MVHIPANVLMVCKEKLIQTKSDILNRMRAGFEEYRSRDKGGDETDLAVDNLAEDQFLTHQERLRKQLLDIEVALAKMERGIYGICEETEEAIDIPRLLAIPWTRLSLEGAEIRDDLSRKYARSK